jgi:2-keto-4-pentenoate hydratase/2-oxohepta-3-ene-1,7-dioic acid hydratase in catechol pathway
MKIARYLRDNRVAFGHLACDGTIERLSSSPFEGSPRPTGERVQLSAVKLLCPVDPPRIFCVGLNYLAHIREVGRENPELPPLFMKPGTALIGPGDAIVYPKGSTVVHYEAELVVVIGRRGRRISEAHALEYVLGYTCGNDVSERIIQRKEMKSGSMLAGKGYDTFAPIGPVIATDLDPADIKLSGMLNGELKQQASTSDLLFPIAMLVSYISDFATLLPGDVIMTGTPSGVGPLSPGDKFEVAVEGVGSLVNPVVQEASVHPSS